ncbi:S-layer homology domain-containing protein [Desulfovirgula thermocuniculi]|uniref:S-layer homology domain-containing protein n=1 Tax=Desulfovirgula thermocuniculi TaxID=348842 RepID=UPI000417F206|nr:S-layer homology domain-containing protein [Desulfovirgula thermocuniculi]
MGAKKAIRKGLSILVLVGLAFALLLPAGEAGAASFNASPADHAVQFLYNEYLTKGAKNADAGVGAYAYYVLCQAEVDVSGWVYNDQSLVDAVYGLIDKDLVSADKTKAKLLAQDLLAARAMGKQDLASQLLNILKSRQNEQGFDSGPFSIFSNLAAYDLLGRAGSLCKIDAAKAKDYVLSTQNKVYGSWGYEWEGQYYPDFMATAQAIRVLYYLDPGGSDEQIQEALSAGLNWLVTQQQADGSFIAGWDDPLIDTAEAILTLKVLGQDSGGPWNNAVSYLLNNAVNPDGTLGGAGNAMDATWLLAACNVLEVKFYLAPSILTLQPGKKAQLKAVWEDAYGAAEVTAYAAWSVDDAGIASVDDSAQKGLVTANGAGSTVIKAVYNGLVAISRLNVQASSTGGTSTGVTVGLAIVGAGGELMYGPSYVTVTAVNKWGLTALGALDASGVSYTIKETAWGPFVDSIEGLASKGTAGWMYTVNNQVPMVGADKYRVKEKDKVIWYYSKTMDQEPPKWEDLVKQASETSSPLSEAQKSLEEALAGFKAGKGDLGKALGVLEQVAKLKDADFTAELRARAAALIEALVPFLNKLPDEVAEVRLRGEEAEVRLEARGVTSQVELMAKAAELGEVLQAKGVSSAENLSAKTLIAQLPREVAGKNFAALLPAEAARALVSGGFAFELAGSEITFTLPAGATEALLKATDNVAWLSVAAGKVGPEHISLPEGTRVVACKLMELELTALTPEGAKERPGTDFAEEITVTVSLEGIDATKVNAKDLAVYRQKKGGSWEYVGGNINPEGRSISFRTARSGVYAILDYRQAFADISSHWAKSDIEVMAKKLIARGVSGDSFAPDQPLTRAQFATFLVRLLGLEEEQSAVPAFADLPPDHWAYGAVAAAFKAGLVKGTGEKTFAPEREITREEIAVVLLRVLEQKGLAKVEEKEVDALLARYSDGENVSTWARKAVAAAVKRGLLSGKPQNLLAPQDKATRAEAMALLKRFGDSLEG